MINRQTLMMRAEALTAAIVATLLFNAPFASAETVVSNLDETTDRSLGVYDYNFGIRYRNEIAQSFTTGSSATTLSSITVKMGDDSGGGDFSLELWSDVSGFPGTSLLTLSGDTNPVTAGLFTYTGSFALNAGTTYWTVGTVPPGGVNKFYTWRGTTSTNDTSDFGWTIGNGANREAFNGVSNDWVSASQFAQLSVDATTVPEPSSTLLLISASAFCLRRRSLRTQERSA